MSKRKFPSVVEHVVEQKAYPTETTSADTFRSDSAAILESLVAEFGEEIIVTAMNNQGFEGYSYRSTLKALAVEAIQRRQLRNES